uniref:Uncharacterized protein n=1 Tax=Ananas comosus var. bracteatus TaxID=296719 RepID=A0A6V7P3Q1_ANACO|nr:unnamed protein product [Ananas comosus var. bracteatus]
MGSEIDGHDSPPPPQIRVSAASNGGVDDDNDDEECATPKGEEYKIKAPKSPPQPPVKPRRRLLLPLPKRRLRSQSLTPPSPLPPRRRFRVVPDDDLDLAAIFVPSLRRSESEQVNPPFPPQFF